MEGAPHSPLDLAELEELLTSCYDRLHAGRTLDLDQVCADVPVSRREAVRGELERLLGAERALLGRLDGGVRKAGGGSLESGRELDGFRIVRLLGRGGMGEVYVADQEALGRQVALKILSGRGRMDPIARLRFQREAAVTAALEHPHIVPVHATGTVDGLDYLVMRLVDGRGLDQLTPLEPRRAALLAMQIAHALNAAHRVGVVHRDVKPANVLVEGDNALLLDFGLAGVDSESTLTRADAVPGTLPYMAPEQLASDGGHIIDPRVDVYGLGATLYELLAGAPPFEAQPAAVVLQQILRDEPRPLPSSVDRDLAVIVARAMDKEPARRFPSAAAFAADLGRYLDGEMIQSRPLGFVPRMLRVFRRHPVRWAAAALLAVAGLVIAQLVSASRQEREDRFRLEAVAFDRALVEMRFAAAERSVERLGELGPGDARVLVRRERLADQAALVRSLLDLGRVSPARAERCADQLRVLLDSPSVGTDPLLRFALAVSCWQCEDREEARAHLAAVESTGRLPRASARLRNWFLGAPVGTGLQADASASPERDPAADAFAAAVVADLRDVSPELQEAEILVAEELDPNDLITRMRLAELRRAQGDVRGCYEILRGVARVDLLWGRVPARLADVSAALAADVGIDRTGLEAAARLTDVWLRRGWDHLGALGEARSPEVGGEADPAFQVGKIAQWRLELLGGGGKDFWADWNASSVLEEQSGYWTTAFEVAFREGRWSDCTGFIDRALSHEVDSRRRLQLRHLRLQLALRVLADETGGTAIRPDSALHERSEELWQQIKALAEDAGSLGERIVERDAWRLAAAIGELRGNPRDMFLSAVRACQADFQPDAVLQAAWPLASLVSMGVARGGGPGSLPQESERYLELVWTWVEDALDEGLRNGNGWLLLHQSRFWLALERADGRALWESAVVVQSAAGVGVPAQRSLIRAVAETGLLPIEVLLPGKEPILERQRLRRILEGVLAAVRAAAGPEGEAVRRLAREWMEVEWLEPFRDPASGLEYAAGEAAEWLVFWGEVRDLAGED